jgi:hypothetical protein
VAAAVAAAAAHVPYVGALGTHHPLSAREMEIIQLGGAEP